LTYFGKGIATTQQKRDRKAKLLAAIEADQSEPALGMTKQEAITILTQDIDDYDAILARMRRHPEGVACTSLAPQVAGPLRGESWHEERDRLVQLLRGVDSGEITHVDNGGMRELQATTLENVAVLRKRLALLNARIGDGPR
jgi:hypothetical protein